MQEEQTETEICIEEGGTSTMFLKERTNDVPKPKKMLQQLVKKQEIKPEQDGSWKEKAFQKEEPKSYGLHHHSCKISISELKHGLLKSSEKVLEVKREESVEAPPSEIKIKKTI